MDRNSSTPEIAPYALPLILLAILLVGVALGAKDRIDKLEKRIDALEETKSQATRQE